MITKQNLRPATIGGRILTAALISILLSLSVVPVFPQQTPKISGVRTNNSS